MSKAVRIPEEKEGRIWQLFSKKLKIRKGQKLWTGMSQRLRVDAHFLERGKKSKAEGRAKSQKRPLSAPNDERDENLKR